MEDPTACRGGHSEEPVEGVNRRTITTGGREQRDPLERGWLIHRVNWGCITVMCREDQPALLPEVLELG